MFNLLLSLQPIAIMKRLSDFFLIAFWLRYFLITLFCSLFLPYLIFRIFTLYSWGSRICPTICYVIWMIEIRFYLFHFLFHFFVHFLNYKMLFFILPLKSISFMLMVKFIDASISFNILTYLLSFSIIDLFHFTQMSHVDFISHFTVHNFSRVYRVYH